MKYHAILFDLDGTLLDTLDDLANSMNSVLEHSGYPGHDREAYRYFVGNGMRNLVKRTLPEAARTDDEIERCFNAMLEEYAHRWDEKTKPYEGIPELLDSLEEKGLKMAVLSNKSDHFTKLMVAKLLSKWNFSLVYGERSNVPKKPDPAAAHEISNQLKIPEDEFLYLGDTNVDMQTAVAAGMYPVGVLWGFRKADELIKGGARILIPKPSSLLALL
jgi:phosphoglycolate phosphatase